MVTDDQSLPVSGASRHPQGGCWLAIKCCNMRFEHLVPCIVKILPSPTHREFDGFLDIGCADPAEVGARRSCSPWPCGAFEGDRCWQRHWSPHTPLQNAHDIAEKPANTTAPCSCAGRQLCVCRSQGMAATALLTQTCIQPCTCYFHIIRCMPAARHAACTLHGPANMVGCCNGRRAR
jgi:hypothetical protein